jgi:dihydroorotate dehydrogenase electron transfer subunit
MIFLADHLRRQQQTQPLVVLGSEVPFPFQPTPSTMLVEGIPEGVIAAMPLLDDWGVASRLASQQDFAGCFQGYLTDLARHWLLGLTLEQRAEVTIYACGPHPMLHAATELARDFDLPVQVSLEEYMACAVGGCAGCTVPIDTGQGVAMRRVCVDGPVFDGRAVFPG